jgi:hypothetical protein
MVGRFLTPMKNTRVPIPVARAGQSILDSALVRIFMAGDEGHVGRIIPVGQGDARIGRRTDGGGDAGNDLEGNAGRDEYFRLFSAAAEDEGISRL